MGYPVIPKTIKIRVQEFLRLTLTAITHLKILCLTRKPSNEDKREIWKFKEKRRGKTTEHYKCERGLLTTTTKSQGQQRVGKDGSVYVYIWRGAMLHTVVELQTPHNRFEKE